MLLGGIEEEHWLKMGLKIYNTTTFFHAELRFMEIYHLCSCKLAKLKIKNKQKEQEKYKQQ